MNDKMLYENAVELLKKLIATPSLSKEEQDTFTILSDFFTQNNIEFKNQPFVSLINTLKDIFFNDVYKRVNFDHELER